VHLAQESRQWAEAERLQRLRVDWARQRAAAALARPTAALASNERNAIRTLAASLHELGDIQREQEQPDCVNSYQEAAELLERIDDQAAAAVAAFNLGHAYKDIPALRDLAQAEHWYRRDLELTDKSDYLGRAQTIMQLGQVARERFKEARAAGAAEAEQLQHLNAALNTYQQALALLPTNAVNDLAVAHNQLGIIYKDAGQMARALEHYQQSARYEEQQGNFYGAGQTRYNVALMLAQQNRLADARAYAEAALRNFQVYGSRAAAEIEETQRLLAAINQA
jgi:tetratricopeptide (TPR) repeat protein